MFGSLPGIAGTSLLGGAQSAFENDERSRFDIPIYGPNGEVIDPGTLNAPDPEPQDPMASLRTANEELQALKASDSATKHELNQALRRVQTLETQLQHTLKLLPTQEEPSTPASGSPPENDFSWGAWNRRPGESPPSKPPQQQPAPKTTTPTGEQDMAISPEEFQRQYNEQRQREIQAENEVRQKLQSAADKFVADPRLAPYYTDALDEFNRLAGIMRGASVDDVLNALNATVNDWISRGYSPRRPFDPKRPGGGIPTGGQQMGPGGVPMVGDNRFRPDEQGMTGNVGFYSDEQRKADADHDRKARQMDLEVRKSYGTFGDGKTYEQYFQRKEESGMGSRR